MLILKGLDQASRLCGPTAISIGNFDGLHLGHQAILQRLVERASVRNLLSLVLTFSPHPEKVLGRKKIAMIQTLSQRLAGLEKLGVQAVLVAPFDRDFSRLTSQEFFKKILFSLLQAKEIVIGQDFRFGLHREGDVEKLRQLGAERGIAVHPVPPVKSGHQIVSSSLIRSLLLEGKVEKANRLLGHPYEIEGIIVPGSARGKRLGFPTANISTENEILPAGVFISETKLDKKTFSSVTNIGFRPTFGRDALQVETFIFNLDRSIYGRRVYLRLLQKIRDEKRFPTPEALVNQVRKDIEVARNYFQQRRESFES